MHASRIMVLVSAWVVAALPAHAQLPFARLTVVDPPGAKAGTSVEVAINGADLEGLRGLHFSRPGLAATAIKDNRFKVTIAPDALSGPVDVRAIGTFGITNPRAFMVGRLDEQREAEPNNLRSQAQIVPLNSVINGTLGGRADVDYFKFVAAQGQRVVIECFAQRIDSRLSAVLTVFDPSDRHLARCRQHEGDDPLIDFVASQPGEYRLQLQDLTYNGSSEHFYRLAIHTGPMIDHVYPPAVHIGTKGSVTLFGRNLPGGTAQDSVRVGKLPLDALGTSLDAPSDPNQVAGLPADVFLPPRQVAIDGLVHRAPVAGSNGWPVLVGLAEHPVVLEREPNDSEATAQSVSIPAELAGRCGQAGDVDWFRFPAKKDQALRIEGISERAGFPTDLVFLLRRVLPAAANAPAGAVVAQDIGEYDDNPSNVGRLKFDTSTHDPLVDFTIPADGDYLLQVRDRYGDVRGDARFVYRVRLAPLKPDFRLAVVPADENNPSAILVRQGGTAFAHVFALRQGGFGGEIKIEAAGLPPGVTAAPVVLGPAVSEAPLVFRAEPSAATSDGPVAVKGTAVIAGRPVTRVARPGTIIWPQGPAQPKPARIAQSFCLSVRDSSPYLLTATPQQVTFGQGSQLTLHLKLERRWADFTGNLAQVTALNLPPNVNNQSVEIGAKQTDGLIHLYFTTGAPTGTYSFIVTGTGQVPFAKDPKANKQNVAVADPSPPITVTILPRTVELGVNPNPPQLKVGQNAQVKVGVNRVNNYKGPVTLKLTVPPGLTGLSAADVTVPADKNEAAMTIACAAGVPPGDKPFATIRGVCTVDNQPVTVDAQVTIKVVQ